MLAWTKKSRKKLHARAEERLASDALKRAMPQYRVQSTNRNQGRGKDAVEGTEGGEVVLLPNTSHREITNWTVKTLAEQSQKYTGAVGSKIRPARQLTNLYICVSTVMCCPPSGTAAAMPSS